MLAEVRHVEDIIASIMEYLSFAEIFTSMTVCKSWRNTCDFAFFNRLCSCRNQMIFKDYGKGKSVPFYLPYLRKHHWKRHVFEREQLQSIMPNDSSQQICFVLHHCYNHTQNHPLQIEGYRLLTHIFDHQTQSIMSDFQSPRVTNTSFMQQLVSTISDDSDLYKTQIAVKTLGILCINESNRSIFSELQIIPRLMHILAKNWYLDSNQALISCILWCLVILSRPLGGIEAEPILVEPMNDEEPLCNVLHLQKLQCTDLILRIAKKYHTKPLILAKVCWLFVNLSLNDTAKLDIIRNGSIEIICDALRSYPNEKELQYRAIFAMVNLGLHSKTKKIVLRDNIIPLILRPMKQYGDDPQILTMCMHCIYSLSCQCHEITHEMIKYDAPTVLREIAERYENENRHLAFITLQQLHKMLQAI